MIFSKILFWVAVFVFFGSMFYATYIIKKFAKRLKIYEIFIHNVEHQVFKWCRFQNLRIEPHNIPIDELEEMLQETLDRLQKKLDRIDELEKRLGINTLK